MPKSKKVAPDDGAGDDHYVAVKDRSVDLGPVRNRKCRDFIFLVLFALFWVAMAIVAATAVKNGNLARLL
jgi:hypothetical protein